MTNDILKLWPWVMVFYYAMFLVAEIIQRGLPHCTENGVVHLKPIAIWLARTWLVPFVFTLLGFIGMAFGMIECHPDERTSCLFYGHGSLTAWNSYGITVMYFQYLVITVVVIRCIGKILVAVFKFCSPPCRLMANKLRIAWHRFPIGW